jgi:hypothetical protein
LADDAAQCTREAFSSRAFHASIRLQHLPHHTAIMERLDKTLPIELVREIILYADQSTLGQLAQASKIL